MVNITADIANTYLRPRNFSRWTSTKASRKTSETWHPDSDAGTVISHSAL